MAYEITAFPLRWPDGWPRTPPSARRRGTFRVGANEARAHVRSELERIDATSVVISSDVPVRRDGMPYASRSWRRGDDPGVALYFATGGVSRAIACDVFESPDENLRALGLSLEALRSLGRYGVPGMMRRAYSGFAALPPPGRSPSPAPADWRAVLGYGAGARPSADDVRARFREMAKDSHPDRGGSPDGFRRLVAARDAAIREVGP